MRSVQQSSAGKILALPRSRANPKCFLPLAPLSSSPGRCPQQRLGGQTGCRIQVSECQSRALPSPNLPNSQQGQHRLGVHQVLPTSQTSSSLSNCDSREVPHLQGSCFLAETLWPRDCSAQAPSLVNNQEHVMEGKIFSLIQTDTLEQHRARQQGPTRDAPSEPGLHRRVVKLHIRGLAGSAQSRNNSIYAFSSEAN